MLKKKTEDRTKQKGFSLLCACLFIGAGLLYCTVFTEQEENPTFVKQEETSTFVEQDADRKIEVQNMRQETQKEIWIHVCGAVENPGVYQVKEESRVCDIISLAGGGTEDSALDALNLARIVTDGERIFVPTVQEAETLVISGQEKTENQKINLNTADKEQLMTLSGIGEAKAEDILAYRTKNGSFQKIEDIMKIPGIKESAFQKIKDKIMVREE